MLKSLIFRALAFFRRRQSRRIPYVELENRQVEGLRTVANRDVLLEYFPQNAVAAELGVLKGDFSRKILDIARPHTLHLVDTWDGREGAANLRELRQRFEAEIQAGKVRLHCGDSVTVLQQFPENAFDWLYIDTEHGYEQTARELKAAAAVLKPGGLIAGHDYVTGNWDNGVRYGVVEAVNEFCVQNDWEFAYLTAETHRHLSFALRKTMHPG